MTLESPGISLCLLSFVCKIHPKCPYLSRAIHPNMFANEENSANTELSLLVVVQLLTCVWLFVTPWTVARQASLSFTISWSLLKLMSIESVMPSNRLMLCCPLLLPSIFPSIRVISSESAFHIRWPKHWSFSFSISPSNDYSGLISLRIDWFNLLSVQGVLKSLL